MSFSQFPPVLQALLATTLTWLVTALGAGVVFLKKDVNRKLLDASLGFSAGIMISASFFLSSTTCNRNKLSKKSALAASVSRLSPWWFLFEID